jgi:hypothetical protein
MSIQPIEITLRLSPKSRLDIVDVAAKISDQYGDLLQNYRKTTCCSFHTTAGYLEQQFCAKLGYSELFSCNIRRPIKGSVVWKLP